MLSTFLDKAGGLLNRRFLIAYWFPTLFAALLLLLPRALVYGLSATWRWWAGLLPPQDYTGEGSPQLALLAGGLLLITLIAYLLQAFTRLIVRTFEGYTWPSTLRRWAAGRAARRWHALKKERAEAASQNDLAHYAHRQDQLYHEYPGQAWLLLPTRLGNVLRAAEGYGDRAYGLDAPFWWPRLWPLLPEKSQAAVDDALTTVISLLNFAALMVYVTADVALYLNGCRIAYCLWWAVGALALGILLIVVAYQGAVAQARSYGQHIRTAIDLYRFELLKALHLPLPATPWEERALWNRLATWLYNNDLGAARDLAYDLGKQDQEAKETEAGPSEGEEIIRSLWQHLWGK
jgi:hypothetical protein